MMSPRNRHHGNTLTALILAILFVSPALAAPQQVGPVRVELVAEQTSIQPGVPFELGLHIVPDEHWHVYWRNPGDAGLPPTLQWDLPPGFTAGDIHWPAPQRIEAGPLVAYGYYGDALYPVTITPPSDIRTGGTVTIGLKADWLVCKVECLPGSTSMHLELPVVSGPPVRNTGWGVLFDTARQRIPGPLPDNWIVQATLDNKYIYLDLRPDRPLPDGSRLEVYVAEKAVMDYAAEQPLTISGSDYRLQLLRSSYAQDDPDSLLGVLTISADENSKSYDLSIPFGARSADPALAVTGSITSILTALLFALLGGLILNLMPCVLPVLSLKVLGLVQQANQGRRSAMVHGLVFTLGVILSFWVIVGFMLVLQAGGEQLGWGFQLQSPAFVMILAGFMFLFALSLFGVYEISFLVGSAAAVNRKKHSGPGSAFVSGITAALVATPCTAPFMGAALGYSLTQPAVISMLIYTCLGLGMAAPYLVLSAFPGLLRFVPKPGRWMETLKQALGFVLAATVIWLGWVLAAQAGAVALVILLGVLLMLSVAAWIYGRWGTVAATTSTRRVSRAIATLILLLALGFGGSGISAFGFVPQTTDDTAGDGIVWEKFTSERLDRLLSEGQPVFIDFTAAWCLSCQVNERVAFSSESVIRRFDQLGIVPLKADWTNRSAEIARALAAYGRNSVPLYVLYDPKNSDGPILLPEILTPGIVLEALEKINQKTDRSNT